MVVLVHILVIDQTFMVDQDKAILQWTLAGFDITSTAILSPVSTPYFYPFSDLISARQFLQHNQDGTVHSRVLSSFAACMSGLDTPPSVLQHELLSSLP